MKFKLEEGQTWHYRPRPHEAGSTLYILKIDESGKYGRVISICVDGLKIKRNPEGTEVQSFLPHIPIAEPSLADCLTEPAEPLDSTLISYGPYDFWKTKFVNGEAGVFKQGVSEILEAVELIALGQDKESL